MLVDLPPEATEEGKEEALALDEAIAAAGTMLAGILLTGLEEDG
jgi:hypothetical protein